MEKREDAIKYCAIPYRELTSEQYDEIMKLFRGEDKGASTLTFKDAPIIQDNCITTATVPVGDKRVMPFEIMDRGRKLLPEKYVKGSAINFMAACYKHLRSDKEFVGMSYEIEDYFTKMGEALHHIAQEARCIRKVDNSKKTGIKAVDALRLALEIAYGYELSEEASVKDCEDALYDLVTRSVSERSNDLSELEVSALVRLLKSKGDKIIDTYQLHTLIFIALNKHRGIELPSNLDPDVLMANFASDYIIKCIEKWNYFKWKQSNEKLLLVYEDLLGALDHKTIATCFLEGDAYTKITSEKLSDDAIDWLLAAHFLDDSCIPGGTKLEFDGEYTRESILQGTFNDGSEYTFGEAEYVTEALADFYGRDDVIKRPGFSAAEEKLLNNLLKKRDSEYTKSGEFMTTKYDETH